MKRHQQVSVVGLLIGVVVLRVLRRGRARRNAEPGEPAPEPDVAEAEDVAVQDEPQDDRGAPYSC